MRGKEVDMDKLLEKNQLMPAVGNAKMNARGDELGPGGKITKKREDTVNEYYENNPAAIIAAKQSSTIVEDSVTFSKDKK
jgi:hypothetical protein